LLLKVNFDAGHGGKSGRFEHLHEVAMEYAFLLEQAGLGSHDDFASRAGRK
jgi:oligopeptidase B